jgi:hypothetical protein
MSSLNFVLPPNAGCPRHPFIELHIVLTRVQVAREAGLVTVPGERTASSSAARKDWSCNRHTARHRKRVINARPKVVSPWQQIDCASLERFFGISGSANETARFVSDVLLSSAARREDGLWGGGTRYSCDPYAAISQIAMG